MEKKKDSFLFLFFPILVFSSFPTVCFMWPYSNEPLQQQQQCGKLLNGKATRKWQNIITNISKPLICRYNIYTVTKNMQREIFGHQNAE
jgi:hypothetical protein